MNEMNNKRIEPSPEETMKILQKELKITRYCSLFVAVLLVLVIVGGIYTVNKMYPALEAVRKMQPTIEKIEELNIEALNQKIEQLDMEELKQIVEEIDVEELSETLRNINDAADKIREIQSGFSGFSDSVSESFSDSFSEWFEGLKQNKFGT